MGQSSFFFSFNQDKGNSFPNRKQVYFVKLIFSNRTWLSLSVLKNCSYLFLFVAPNVRSPVICLKIVCIFVFAAILFYTRNSRKNITFQYLWTKYKIPYKRCVDKHILSLSTINNYHCLGTIISLGKKIGKGFSSIGCFWSKCQIFGQQFFFLNNYNEHGKPLKVNTFKWL